MINNVTLVGRLTKDVELRYTQTNKPVANFTVAVNRTFGNREEADFITCVAWNKTAEFMHTYLRKGSLIGLTGRIETGTYQDQTGQTRYKTEVIANSVQSLESKSQSQTIADTEYTQQYQQPSSQPNSYYQEKQEDKVLNISSDDLPF